MEEFARALEEFGREVGKAACRQGKRIEYLCGRLRRTASPDRFYELVSEAQYEYRVIVPEKLLEPLLHHPNPGAFWRRAGTILAVHIAAGYADACP